MDMDHNGEIFSWQLATATSHALLAYLQHAPPLVVDIVTHWLSSCVSFITYLSNTNLSYHWCGSPLRHL